MLTISEVMTRDVVTVHPDMTLTELDRHLVSARVSGAPVVEDGVILGVVSQSDVVRTLYTEQLDAQRNAAFYDSPFPLSLASLAALARDRRKISDHMTRMRVREIMTPAPARVAPDEPVGDVARLMAQEGIHRLPVVEGEQLVGIVSAMDFVRLLGDGTLGEAGGGEPGR